MSRGTNLEYARGYNRRTVLETIRRHGPISRGEIVRRTSLAVQTIANIVHELLDSGLVVSGGRRQGKRGSPSHALQINPQGAYAIGVNFDRDRVTGVLLDFSGAAHEHAQLELEDPAPERVLPLLAETVERLLGRVEREKVLGVAIGAPGPIHRKDRRGLMPCDLVAWEDVSVGDEIAERFGLPTFVERNADAAAIGEYWYGVGLELPSFFYVYVGIGLGSALMNRGSLYRDEARLAGKIGYVPVLHGGTAPYPLKDAFSFGALKRHLTEHGIVECGPEAVEGLYADGDATLAGWLDAAAEALAPVLLSVECLLRPPAIVFGGRLPPGPLSHVLARAHALLAELRTDEHATIPPRLLIARASEHAAAMGVATVPLYEQLTPDHALLLKREGSAVVHGAGPL